MSSVTFCRPHWGALREAIRTRGLWPLVSTSGEEAARRTAGQGRPDPLMTAHNLLLQWTLDRFGEQWAFGRGGCPACKLAETGDFDAIKQAADLAQREAATATLTRQ